MARPPKEGLDYFSHDTDAVNDEKIEALRSLYGNDGYAFYFILLERIYRSAKQEIDVSDAETIQILASKVSVSEQKFAEMLQTALKRGCFDKNKYENEGILTSNGIKKRSRPVLTKRALMKDKYWDEKGEEVSDEFLKQNRAVKESKDKVKDKSQSTLRPDPKDSPDKENNIVYDEQSYAYRAANYLRTKILENNPRERVPLADPENKNMQAWAREMDRLNRLGPVGAAPSEKKGYDWKEIRALIDWCQDDEFWRANILSPAKFREQIGKIEARRRSSEGGKSTKTPAGPGKYADLYE